MNQDVKAQELKTKLTNGVVSFQFSKKDGSVRNAIGTLNFNHIPAEANPKGTGVKPTNTIAYYDLEKQEWRSFLIENLLDEGTYVEGDLESILAIK